MMTKGLRWPAVVGWAAVAVNLFWGAVGWQFVGEQVMWDSAQPLLFSVLGALILTSQPRNWAGFALLAPTCSSLASFFASFGASDGSQFVDATFAAGVAGVLEVLGELVLFVIVPFLVPNGELPKGPWRWAFGLNVVVLAATAVLAAAEPGFSADQWWLGGGAVAIVVAVCSVVAVLNLVQRYGRSIGQLRAQMAWILLGLITMQIVYVVPAFMSVVVTGDFWNGPNDSYVFVTLWWLAPVAVPVTWGIAILRHSLLELNPLVHRLLVLVVLAEILTVVCLVALPPLASSPMSQVTVAIALAMLSPALHRWLYAALAGLVYGRAGPPERVVAALIRRLARAATPDEVLSALADAVADQSPASRVDVALIGANKRILRRVERGGAGGGHSLAVPLTFQGTRLGFIEIAASRDLDRAERDLLNDLAGTAAGALGAAHRTVELQRAREKLVIVREGERRRIGRDVHDGLGPILSGLGFKTDALHDRLRDRPRDAVLAAYIREQLGEAGQLVRRIARELRPTAVDRLGLVPAIAELAGQHSCRNLLVHLHANHKDLALAPAVEVAAYAIATEAIKNAAQHANATDCWVSITRDGTSLQLVIEDNRIGINQAVPGVGMTSLRERAEELGGTFELLMRDGGGTRVLAYLPVIDSDVIVGAEPSTDSSS